MEIYRELNAWDYSDLASLSVWETNHAIMILLGYTCDNADYAEPQQERLEAESSDLVNGLWNDHESGGRILEGIIRTAVLGGELAVIKKDEADQHEYIRPRELIAFLRDNPAASMMLDLSVWDKHFAPTERQIQASELRELGNLNNLKGKIESVIYATMKIGIITEKYDNLVMTKEEFRDFVHKMLRSAKMDDLSDRDLDEIWRQVPSQKKLRGRRSSTKVYTSLNSIQL